MKMSRFHTACVYSQSLAARLARLDLQGDHGACAERSGR
jgi:hypothetical protein